jgi:glycosyltransferase involved in cell wall biosynthesis
LVHRLAQPASKETRDRERELLAVNSDLRLALVNNGSFDIVYQRHSLWSYAAMEYAARAGVPGLLEVNAPLVEEQAEHRDLVDTAGAKRAVERAYTAAGVLLAVSQGVAEHLVAHPAATGRIEVLPNGVDPERIRPDITPSLPRPPGSFTIGFVGTLKPWHGLDTLIDAFARVQERRQAVRLLIVGDGPERERVANRFRERGLADAVDFTGAVGSEAVPALLTSMDVGVAPYPGTEHFYFSPLKIYEYMAAGLPVVASDIGQVSEAIHDRVTGLLCPPGDARALADAIERLIVDPELRRELGRNGRDAARRHHSWSAVTARILELAEHIGQAPAPAGAGP